MFAFTPSEKVFLSVIMALLVFFVTSIIIGEEKKAKWFQKRKKYSFFLRRGIIGEIFHFGYPATVEGIGITLGMFSIIGLFAYIIAIYF